MVNDGEEVSVELHGIKNTGRSRDEMDVLEVSLMVWSDYGGRTFTGWVYPEEVELQSDPDDWNLHPDELKDLMAQAASDWDSEFADWGTSILSREDPVGGKN